MQGSRVRASRFLLTVAAGCDAEMASARAEAASGAGQEQTRQNALHSLTALRDEKLVSSPTGRRRALPLRERESAQRQTRRNSELLEADRCKRLLEKGKDAMPPRYGISREMLYVKHPLRAVESILWMHKARRRRTFDQSTIYDVGMHIGQDTAFYLKKGFRVVAIEANCLLVEAALRHFSPFVRSGQLSILNLGITSRDDEGDLEFFINEKISEWSSFDKRIASRMDSPVRSVLVPTSSLTSVISKYGPAYYVKIDIEGHDVIALRSLLSTEPKPRYISVENGNQGMLGMLAGAGYDQFKYIQQRDIPGVRLPRRAREGEYTAHLFPRGSSGPFGEETLGNWKSAEEIEEEIARIWDVEGTQSRPGHNDKVDGWFDLHARHSESVQ